MKRHLGLAFIAIIVVTLTLLLLPTSLAKRGPGEVENTNPPNNSAQTGQALLPLPDLFRPTAQKQSSAAPIVVRASNYAESAPVRDLPPTARTKASNGKTAIVRDRPFENEKDGEEGEKEINEQNKEIIRRIDPDAPRTPDTALSYKHVGVATVPLALPTPTVNFDGISEADTVTIGQGFLPPDTNGEVGPNHYVQTVNSAFRVWDKNGTPLTPLASLSSLFAPLGSPCGGSNDGDPVTLYDQLSDRWLITQFCLPSGSTNIGPFHELLAVSKTGDPAGAYYLYDFITQGTNRFPDYPHLGVWPDAYYMTVNQFDGNTFAGSGMYAFNRTKMIAGDPTANYVYFNSTVLFTGNIIGGMLPADLDGYVPPAPGTPCPFAYFTANEFGDPGDALRLFDFHVDFTTPANSTFTERAGSPLAVAAFDPNTVPADSRNVIPQPPPATAATYLDAISDRLMFRLAYRNFGSKETLVVNHTVNASGSTSTYRAGARVYQLSRATPAATWGIDEQTTWAGALPTDTDHRWMGSAAQNYLGDLVLGFSASGLTTSPSVRYAAKLASDPPGSGLAQGEQTLIAGTSQQTSTSGRWGDYSDLTIDPSDDCTFWYTQEYMGGGTVWKTRIGKFSVRTCTTSPRGSVQGTITNCQTGLPVANALVTINGGGFSRATNAAGTYSATVPPGTYTASVTGPNFDTATSGSLVVSNGGTATFSACLNGTLKQPAADTATVTADSCNSNGVIDPNETITINLGIKNTGNLNTVNLVATMLPTGGVTAPSAPQNYGVLIAGGATVFKTFTFTSANLSCGSPLVITLALQDGATNLGTITYNFNVGQLLTSLYSSGNVAVAIPDNVPAGVDVPITVSDVMTLSDVNVSVRLNHTFVGDLKIDLVHPDNTTVNLVNLRGGSGVNFGSGPNDCSGTPTVFDDQATININTITSAGAPYASTFKPEGSLAALNGKPSNGTWKLHVSDNANLDSGTIGCVKLELNRRFACCGPLIAAAPPVTITSESISPANNAPDPDETVTVNFPVINNGAGATTNLVATLLPTGGVVAPSGPQTYGVIAPGATATKAFTFAVNGACGSNITATLALQDGLTSLGTISYTMKLGTTSLSAPQTFSNTAAITIPAAANTAGESSPYPSNIAVSGLTGTVSKVTVTLNNLTHAFASDIDMLLVGPGGQKFIILSDAIRSGVVTGATYTLDDAAATLMPSTGPPASGTYKPANYGTGDTFPSPAPAAPYETPATAGSATFASVFNGTNPNGTWSLYVVDDFRTLDSGAMAGGWAITITTAVPTCATQACTINVPSNITVPRDGTCGAIVNYPFSYSGACGAVTVSQDSGTFFPIGTTTVNIASNPGGSPTTNSFTVTVTDSETQPTGAGSNVTNNYCNTTVKFSNVNGAGQTTVVNAPPQTLPPPYSSCAGCPQLDITTTATFTGPITTCITMPASTDFNTFSRMRILHGEGGPLVNRTSSSTYSSKTLCAVTNSLSPFVVALDAAAPTAAPGTISGQVTTGDGQPLGGVVLSLSGALNMRTITDSAGRYSFVDVPTDGFYTVVPDRANYGFSPKQRAFSLVADKTDAIFTATPDATERANPLDTSEFFVRQQYLDFLGREPDGGGLGYWSSEMQKCGTDQACINSRRIGVSAAFFIEQEYQQTGSFVYRLYRGALGRQVNYSEFSADRQMVVADSNLDASRAALATSFVQRPEFTQRYGGNTTAESFVDALVQTMQQSSGVNLAAQRGALIDKYRAGRSINESRSLVLQSAIEDGGFKQAVYNASFVQMQYFGYLKRDPEQEGFDFWLNVLNDREPGNYRGMVCSFITSAEYQKRFASVITHNNQECR